MVGQEEQLPTQVLEDQLALSQPEGADCSPTLILAQPGLTLLKVSKFRKQIFLFSFKPKTNEIIF